ncbi:MBL fold metallo-hydrolase [Desulfobulbus oligotrophicus]|jgi:glyoxylase-like metal-dependent hydrolase (beta-lactamase superfamily II)|uniref:MBL fold metallo-hydrolase n=1 Tax=Desulfobulbus oligotrophicus TaxID=1909699 RepID=A0A7T5VFA7_9BACT|nr:MBL fold metallo-hydrolase [Desulfobulbus oligotrophicus]MDY0389912.1 MBL fold metallo-hydrolase [Desulfobulbus oligotrophicus]QQG66829.1 MBL fold metallo-hydrolase [Desulfobulbus oligotrophicus]
MLVQQLTVGMMGVCCYIASCEDTKEAAIIDPGGDEDRILDHCRKNDLKVIYIINTHGHPDHVCGNAAIQEATKAKIVMHAEDVSYFNEPGIKGLFSSLGLPESPPVDVTVKDGDVITIGKEQLEVIHTPGHTPGGICLYSPPHCFTGDTLFVGAVGRTDFPGGSMRQLIDGIKSRLMVLPPDTIVWPGHGYGGSQSTIEREKRTNPYLDL